MRQPDSGPPDIAVSRAASDDLANDRPNDLVGLGRISGLFGVRGWVKVHSDTDPRENIVKYSRWQIRRSTGWRAIGVLQGKRQGKTVVAQLDGVNDREAAESLVGCEIAVPRAELPALGTNEYYWTDLIGMDVHEVNGERIGSVVRLFETGANDVMVVSDERQPNMPSAEILVPWLIPSVITEVNLSERRVTVDWDPDF